MQHNSLYQNLSAATRRLVLVLCLWVPGVFAGDSALKPLNVLILSPSANPWNEQTTNVLLDHFAKEGPHVVVHQEMVNPSGKRGVPAISVEQLNARYANANIDYVIATTPTEGMLPYLKKAGNSLLPNAIKIYQAKTGKTFKATQSIDTPNTLLVERPVLIDKALEQALQLHQPKQLYLFTNPQSTGYLDKTLVTAVETLTQQGALTAQINYMPLMSTQGYIDYLRAQPAKDGMVFFTAEFNDANGPVVPAVMINTIAAGIDMPVVPYFGSMMTGNGALGGFLQSPFEYGELLADVVLEHQYGRLFDYDTYRANKSEEGSANYPVIPIHQNIFDDAQLHRLGIAHRKLPNNAIIINEQHDYFIPGNYVTEILVISLLVAVLLIAGMRVVIVARTASLKRAEQALASANKQLSSDLLMAQQRALHIQTNLEATGIGLIILSLETGKVLDANQGWADTLGYSIEELKQLSLSEIDPSIPEDKIDNVLKGIQRDGKRHLQSRQRTKDGRLVDVDVSLVAAEANGDLPAHIVSFVMDITEEKASMLCLEQVYRAMTSSRTGYVVLSLDGVKVLDLNSALADLWGMSKEEALQLQIKDIEHVLTPEEVQQAAYAVKEAGVTTFVSQHKRRFGGPMDVEVTAIYQAESYDYPESVVCFVRDVSETVKAQKEVKKQQAYFSSVFESLVASGMGVWMLSYDTKRLVDCSETFAEGLGYTREEVLASPVENVLSLFSPSVIDRAKELSQKRKDLTYPYFEMQTKAGEKKIYRVATYAWEESPWGPNVLVGISSDITEQARMTQETKERGQQLEAIFDTAPFAIFIADRSGHIRWCNDNACELFGMHSRDLTKASLKQLMDPGSYQHFKDDLNHALKVNELLNVDVSIKSESKGIVPINMMGSSVMHIGEESVIYFAVDQTDRIAKENELIKSRDLLKQQSEQFKRYLDSAPISVGILEGDRHSRRYTYVNDQMCETFGYSRDQLIGLNATLNMFVLDEERDEFNRLVWASMDNDENFVTTAQMRLGDGSSRYFELAGRYRREGEKLFGTLFYYDITERIKYEQAQAELLEFERKLSQSRKLQAMGNLLGGMAHSLNNQLQPISVLLSLLKRRVNEDAKAVEYVGKMETAANAATDILQRTLATSRAEHGYGRTDFNQALANALDIALLGMPPNIKVSQQLKQVTGFGPLDQVDLEVVLLNLVNNAKDAIGVQQGHIDIQMMDCPPEPSRVEDEALLAKRWICLCVKDDGAGMSPEQLSRVLDPLYTTKPVGQGTGLGLSETQGLVSRAGGYITVDSEEGDGASICVHLPIYDSEENENGARTVN